MMTKEEAKQIDNLLTELVRAVGMNVVNAVKRARETIVRCTEGRTLVKQRAIANLNGCLPKCGHGRMLMDWSGEQLVPQCGCRLVEPNE